MSTKATDATWLAASASFPSAVRARAWKVNAALVVLVALACGFSIVAGKVWLPWDAWTSGDPRWLIIAELRIPRTVLGLTVGAALGLAGAAMQGYLRNPLADPGLFGIAQAGSLGAVISLYFGFAASAVILPFFALGGAAGGMMLLAMLAGRSGSLILFALAGMMLASVASALTTLVLSL